MSYDTPTAPSLFDLLARVWSLPGPVEDMCFNRENSAVAYAGGGILAIVPVDDPENPEKRIRVAADSGRQSIMPREKPVRPATEVKGLRGALAPFRDRAFITGSDKGGLVSVTPRGQVVPLSVAFDGPPSALARDPAAPTIAAATGTRLVLFPETQPDESQTHDAGETITALAFAPQDGHLAAAHAGGVSFYRHGAFVNTVALDGIPDSLTYSPDGGFLACGLREPGFALIRLADGAVDMVLDYPTPVRSLDWSKPGQAFATSGAFRPAAWAFTPQGRGEPLVAGRTGLVVVDRIAAAPNRPLIAAGYASGLVCLAQLGSREEMLLRSEGGAVTALAWEATGSHLAFGDARGAAGLISFPPSLFK